MEGLILGEGIDWASLIVESKFTVFALFYFECEGNFQVQAPGGGGDLTEGFLRYESGGAYIWRDLFSELYGNLSAVTFLKNVFAVSIF